LVKIGHSTNPKQRITDLRVGDPSIDIMSVYHVDNAPNIERVLHHRARQHSKGGEWYNLDEHVLGRLHSILVSEAGGVKVDIMPVKPP